MTTIGQKVAHVKAADQTRRHRCHWPGCEKQVPPAMWGCKLHWYKLPAALRDRIWRAYDLGQEETGRPSAIYVQVAREVQDWIRAHQAEEQAEAARLQTQAPLDF